MNFYNIFIYKPQLAAGLFHSFFVQVPSGGGLVIQGPLGFEFPTECQPEAGPLRGGWWLDFGCLNG